MGSLADTSDMHKRVSRQRRPHATLRALVVLVVISLLAAACGSEEGSTLAVADDVTPVEAPQANGSDLADVTAPPLELDSESGLEAVEPVVDPVAQTDTTTAPATSTTSTTAPPAAAVETGETSDTAPVEDVAAVSTWVATATSQVTHLVAYDSPGGSVIPFEFIVPNPHQFGGPQVLMVTQGQPGDDWVEVQLPIRPNLQTGWIDASLYTFSQTQVRAEVNLSARSVTVYDGTDIIAQTQAVIGSPATPTPLGTFFITAKRRSLPSETFLGPWALALSAFSEVHETFGGGLPVIAIHGTSAPHQVGDARSNGCLRIPNDVVTLLAEMVPLGAPVTISA